MRLIAELHAPFFWSICMSVLVMRANKDGSRGMVCIDGFIDIFACLTCSNKSDYELLSL